MRISLRTKLTLLIGFLTIALSAATLYASTKIIRYMIDSHYEEHTEALAATVATVLDGQKVHALYQKIMETYASCSETVLSDQWGSDAFNAYVANFSYIEDTKEYQELRQTLHSFQEINEADCIYLISILPEEKRAIYLVDAADEDACPPGCLDILYETNYAILDDPERGFPPYITNTEEYGWLVTAAAPVYDQGDVVSYCAVDVSMNSILATQLRFVSMTALFLGILMITISIIGNIYIDRTIIVPMKQLTKAASAYSGKNVALEMKQFNQLNIHTKDEIEELAESMKQMEQDVHDYYTNLLAARQELVTTRVEAETMNRLAYIDAQTGVRNKRAYVELMEELDERLKKTPTTFCIAIVDLNDLKRTNDLYGHEKGDVAIDMLCGTICTQFEHSPVFRIGGDEFAIIFENKEYEQRNALITSFRQRIKELSSAAFLQPWERISAAIGSADYDPVSDCCTEDVFQRADHDMYKHKKEMKQSKR